MFSATFITLEDIYIAYRKAKQDAFYDSFYPNSILFSKFEANLKNNLAKLHNLIISDVDYFSKIENIGGFLYVPKSIDDNDWSNNNPVHFRSVNPNIDWKQRFKENKNKKLNASYRLIITPTVQFQIFSALWILKVGQKFDAKLDERYSYGNRLRRKFSLVNNDKEDGEINKDAIGLFLPYFSAYKNWRQNGLNAMKDLLHEGKHVTAITMDLASFYHRVTPDFILRESFLKRINVELSISERKISEILINSLNEWYKSTPDHQVRPEGALPVGLSASKVISNILLYELDEQISTNILPKYYGRYVDDIFLVFETPSGLLTSEGVIRFLNKKIDCLVADFESNEQPSLRLKIKYALDSDLEFTSSKQKIFSLSSEYGLDLINQISNQIRLQSSEYRMLPLVPDNSTQMAEKTLLASSDASLIADALRKADAVSIRRLGLSLLLRDIESYSKDLKSREWFSVREQFYGLIERYLLTPKGFFEFFSYFSRIFQIMISNEDFINVGNFIEKLKSTLSLIKETTKKKSHDNHEHCAQYLVSILSEVTLKASTHKRFDKWSELHEVLKSIKTISLKNIRVPGIDQIKIISHKLLVSDLGLRPYKDYWYYEQAQDADCITKPKLKSVRRAIRLGLIDHFYSHTRLKKPFWPALAFSTRPLSVQEMVLICPEVLSDNSLLKRSIMALRGARVINPSTPGFNCTENDECYFYVPSSSNEKVNIALTSFQTTNQTYEMVVKGNPDRSVERYERINKLINNILSSRNKVDYIIFPECSFPRKWAISVASKLGRQGISLIAGLEYYRDVENKQIRNDSLISLSTDWPGYKSNFLIVQPKINPSHDEKERLEREGDILYVPSLRENYPVIFNHGGYLFGVLICSDLTNPLNRSKFQGKIDTLFVLEWNADVNTFSYLVEGASHDIHTYVVQVNNRMYGDSRVRTPYRKAYQRDMVRLKGGVDDYFVIAELDYLPLREFQINGVMTDSNSEFKPTPIGFTCSNERNTTRPLKV